ncbi:hypothetical protein M404DRAFT_26534 [Pisolithus tinctorius Marx 270]|uniref:Uncharacterized protein n=1 Tax=Pisolithus tinctorius Marx 270 TaxID=870435 RepID=A0A0C3K347_PISTI|nr:hypothetical protein M404DRAFT_26534 [Pisolithus tinctorius Marx 270]
METTFPLFKFAENGWKLEYICTRGYLAWSKHYLDNDGKLKRATLDTMKEEALDDVDEDLQDHKPSKKWRGQTELEALHNKKAKVDDMAVAEPPKVAALRNGQPATTPVEILATQSNPLELFTAPDNKENIPVVNHVDVTQPPVSYDPMSLLAVAAMKVKTSPMLPIPDSPIEHESVPPCVSQVEDASKKKFRPSGTKNGCNLCILQWLKCVNPNSKKEEFHFYYDKTLTTTQHKEYDKEAKQLVQDNA